jgi:hypothetical protein
MAKFERVERKLALAIRDAEVRQQFALTNCPRGPWNKERALKIEEEIQEYKEALKVINPHYDYKQERFVLDFNYQLFCPDYPSDGNGEKLWKSLDE